MSKKQLTTEEKMNNALVPEEEWPYKLPDNWCWVRMNILSSLHRGVSYKKSDAHTNKQENDCLILRGGNIREGSIDIEADNVYISKELVTTEQIVKAEDIIIVASTGSTKVIGRAGISFCNYSDVAFGAFLMLVRPNKNVHSRYMAYYFQSDLYRNKIRELASGVNINNIRADYILSLVVPLPPLQEQQRIVSRIESLFAKLDEAKEKIQNVLDGAENRKAAILHQAFTGKLTAKWRKKNGVSDDSWEEMTLDSICASIYDGDHTAPPKTESGIPFLVISNVNDGQLSFENTRFVPKEYYDSISDIRKPKIGDVLYTIVGSYGIPVVVDDDRPFCFQRHMALLKPSKVATYFLWYQLQTKEFYNKATEIATGTAQLTVPIKGLRKLNIFLCSLPEQKEIVRLLDNFLDKEKSICESCEASLSTIETIKKSILAKAFRGELGTNNPAEESAKELLTNCLTTVV